MWKKSEDYGFLSELPSQVIQQKLKDLDKAFKDAFDKNQPLKRIPVFKRKGQADSIRDMGIKRFATLSNGTVYEPLNSFKKAVERLATSQRQLKHIVFLFYVNPMACRALRDCHAKRDTPSIFKT